MNFKKYKWLWIIGGFIVVYWLLKNYAVNSARASNPYSSTPEDNTVTGFYPSVNQGTQSSPYDLNYYDSKYQTLNDMTQTNTM